MHKPRRKFTDKEIAQLEGYGAIRLPMKQIGSLFGLSKTHLEQLIKKDDRARNALLEGRAKASAKVRGKLYEKAAIEGDVQALKFWLCTQETGFQKVDRVELSGPDKKPIEITAIESLSDEELDRRLEVLKQKT